jgi:FixJ family two-component response regulator
MVCAASWTVYLSQRGVIHFGGDALRDSMASRRSVAIVDDDTLVRSAIASLARSYGLTTASFGSAEEFLQADIADFDCVLSDIQMPGMSGFDLQRTLYETSPHTPVVIMTALGEPQLREQAMSAGALGFLDKPFDPAEVVALLEEVFGPL